ncbi:Uncharacterised protein [Mycobacterium tuberculosis]|nr:Uncharacterised protein [Mycobacterium tuberculosis]
MVPSSATTPTQPGICRQPPRKPHHVPRPRRCRYPHQVQVRPPADPMSPQRGPRPRPGSCGLAPPPWRHARASEGMAVADPGRNARAVRCANAPAVSFRQAIRCGNRVPRLRDQSFAPPTAPPGRSAPAPGWPASAPPRPHSPASGRRLALSVLLRWSHHRGQWPHPGSSLSHPSTTDTAPNPDGVSAPCLPTCAYFAG